MAGENAVSVADALVPQAPPAPPAAPAQPAPAAPQQPEHPMRSSRTQLPTGLSGPSRASHVQGIADLVAQATPPQPDDIQFAPPAQPVALAPSTLAPPGTTVDQVPVADPAQPAPVAPVEGDPAAPGGEQAPAAAAEPEVSITLAQWETLMQQRETEAFDGVASPAQSTPAPEQGVQAPEPVQAPALPEPAPQAFQVSPEEFAEIQMDPTGAKMMDMLERRDLAREVQSAKRVNAQVTHEVGVYIDNYATLNEVYVQHPELKRYPHQTGRALIAAKAANPNAQMFDLVKQIGNDMELILKVEQKVRDNPETVDVRTKSAGQFVNAGPARAGSAALPTPAGNEPAPNSTEAVFGEILDAARNGKKVMRGQLSR